MTGADTGVGLSHAEPRELTGVKSLVASAALIVKLAAATTTGVRLCFLELNAATRVGAGSLAESSTQLRELMPEIKAKLDCVLNAAREEFIEDGMRNVINQQLPELLAKHFDTVIPALISVIEARRTTSIIAAEVLKEFGRVRNTASHFIRRWALERSLSSSSPIIRDGAGLGLARLSDPDSLPYLRRAIENERDAQTRADLQLVLDELSEAITDGAPLTDRH
jgi:hypothetical protein